MGPLPTSRLLPCDCYHVASYIQTHIVPVFLFNGVVLDSGRCPALVMDQSLVPILISFERVAHVQGFLEQRAENESLHVDMLVRHNRLACTAAERSADGEVRLEVNYWLSQFIPLVIDSTARAPRAISSF